MAFLAELTSGKKKKLRKTETKEINWGEKFKNDKEYWARRGQINEIRPTLFLTSLVGASRKEEMQELKITHILTCGKHLEFLFPDDFKYEKLDLVDRPEQDLSIALQAGITFIEQALEQGGKVLVHCKFGISRSASVVVRILLLLLLLLYIYILSS